MNAVAFAPWPIAQHAFRPPEIWIILKAMQVLVPHVETPPEFKGGKAGEAAIQKQLIEQGILKKSGRGRARLAPEVEALILPAVLPELLRLPLDFLALDLVQGAETVDALVGVRTAKTLLLGLVDARNTRLESPEAIARQAMRFAGATGSPECFVTTSNSLEFLPRGTARRKIEVLARAARIAGGRA